MKKELKISAIENGTVIDHIPASNAFKAVSILGLENHDNVVSVANNLKSKVVGKKCLIKVGGKSLTKDEVNKIAIIAPDATVNIIKDYDVKEKISVSLPTEMENVVKCSNPQCITNAEKVRGKFYVLEKKPLKVKCHYCERCFKKDIELI
ncbi:MAG: aspartate carbamoyltransferase regulatory subunit [Candidatus Woesearchaeota archaeon]|jgi:aspartate carbamoyltransferase regulatory subunit|nr:aspartate carbamoyltransferase regulatory subunit [Candidatus Woesearchaeota archaeon]